MRFSSYILSAVALAGGLSSASPIHRNLAPLLTPSPPVSPNYNVLDRYQADEALPFSSLREDIFAAASSDTNDNKPHGAHIIPDSYIIRFKDHVEPHHARAHREKVQEIHSEEVSVLGGDNLFSPLTGFIHEYILGDDKHWGYSGKFSERVLDQIRALPEVAYVERDSIVWANNLEKGAPWGLARISHRDPLSFGTFSKYLYEGDGGEGVDAYVIDTGINVDHEELEGRAEWGTTVPQDQDKDLNGHGSHVAGTIASKTYGVAKKANVIAVKVLGAGGSGSMSDVVMGVSWAATSAAKKAKEGKPGYKGAVANMSLGGGKSQALDDAVDASVDKGLHFAVAAGNDNRDACTFSPAASPKAITVGASTIQDDRAYFSNHGECVDIFAPGLNILSIWNSGPTAINTISGTSMASPHIAGLAAYYLSLYPHTFTPSAEDYKAAGVTPPASKFNPAKAVLDVFEDSMWLPSVLTPHKQMVFDSLRQWSKASSDAVASGKDVLEPKVLKAAMIRLATEGVLTDLPGKTVNLLAFNNYTSTN